MVCAVIDNVQKNLPRDEVFVFAVGERFLSQRFVLQIFEIGAHGLLDDIPMGTEFGTIVKVGRVERFGDFHAAQPAEPRIVHADEVNDLVSDGAVGVFPPCVNCSCESGRMDSSHIFRFSEK